MRIGLVIYGSLRNLSGGYLYDRKLVDYLKNSGDRVEIFSLPWRAYTRCFADNLCRSLLKRLVHAKLDILLQDELNHPSLFLLNCRLKSLASYPIISIVHHLRCRESRFPIMQAFYRFVEKRYLRSVDGFVFNSHSTKRSVEKLIGKVPHSVTAFPGGDRLGSIDQKQAIVGRLLQKGPLRLIFVGNLIPRKGIDRLISALAMIKDEAWELSVAGSLNFDRGYAAAIKKRIARLSLEHKITLLGPLSDTGLKDLLKQSHVMAMPFAFEGFGIIYLEAMAYGIPAFAGSTGGAKEIVRHNETGYLFDSGDFKSLTFRLQEMIHDRHKLLSLSLAARRHYDTFPTWKQSAAKIRNFLYLLRHKDTKRQR
jgi:glycosyltransferase involved in cell wall biosynthesis